MTDGLRPSNTTRHRHLGRSSQQCGNASPMGSRALADGARCVHGDGFAVGGLAWPVSVVDGAPVMRVMVCPRYACEGGVSQQSCAHTAPATTQRLMRRVRAGAASCAYEELRGGQGTSAVVMEERGVCGPDGEVGDEDDGEHETADDRACDRDPAARGAGLLTGEGGVRAANGGQ